MPRLALAVAFCGLALLLSPVAALADGDPASDVLVAQGVFVPWDAGVPPHAEAQLAAVVAAASASGYRIRVALIASAKDLGSVTALWREPQTYADYLGDELSLVFQGRVLVVMPNGFGVYPGGAGSPAERRALAILAGPTRPRNFAALAATAVERLASTAGHPIARSRLASISSPALGSSSSDPTPWIVFLAGLWLSAIAWWASVRAKPPRFLARRLPPPGSD